MSRTPPNSRYAERNRGSLVVASLESAWQALRSIELQIPPAVLTLVDVSRRQRLGGYFAHSAWKKPGHGGAHEIAINPRLLQQPPLLLATLLHEAAHAVLHEAGKNAGIGSTRYYHTKVFRNLCIQYGLDCRFRDTRYGWTDTAWPLNSGVPDRWKPVLEILKTLPSGAGEMRVRRHQERKLPATGRTRLICHCENKKRVVYVPKSVVAAGGIICSYCRKPFHRDPAQL